MAEDQIRIRLFNSDFKNSHNRDKYNVSVAKVSGGPQNALAYVYRCYMVEDNDGAPNCYGLDNPDNNLFAPGVNRQMNLTPLERAHGQRIGLANATLDAQLWAGQVLWVGLYATTPREAADNGLLLDTRPELRSNIPDKNGRVGLFPVVKRDGEYAGYYVSTSGVPADGGSPNEWDQSHWIDAAATPYAVWANQWGWTNSGVNLGDGGLAINNNTGAFTEFKFLDTGTNYNVGECSRKLCRTLVPTPDSVIYVPNEDYISFIVFPNSRTGAGVSAELAKLAAADNSDELILFLALGADIDRYKAWLRRFYHSADYHSVHLPNEFYTILMALSAKGYPTDGIFHGVERSVNLN